MELTKNQENIVADIRSKFIKYGIDNKKINDKDIVNIALHYLLSTLKKHD